MNEIAATKPSSPAWHELQSMLNEMINKPLERRFDQGLDSRLKPLEDKSDEALETLRTLKTVRSAINRIEKTLDDTAQAEQERNDKATKAYLEALSAVDARSHESAAELLAALARIEDRIALLGASQKRFGVAILMVAVAVLGSAAALLWITA